ncbi:MAG: hypothetical protein ACI8WT_002536 [Clostridium sp.]|jgi:hypothetical protein
MFVNIIVKHSLYFTIIAYIKMFFNIYLLKNNKYIFKKNSFSSIIEIVENISIGGAWNEILW